MLKICLNFVILIFVFVSTSYSQLIIQPRMLTDNFTIDDSEFPKLSSQIKVMDNGKQIAITKDNIMIMEGAFITNAIEVSAIENGWQKVVWIPEKQDFTLPVGYVYRVAMIVTVDTKVGSNSNFFKELTINPYFNIKASVNLQDFAVREYNFGSCNPGDSIPVLFKFKGLLVLPDKTEERMFLDSITVTNSKVFKLLWDGSNSGSDNEKPPRYLATYGTYRLFIYFKPETNESYQDELVFHYQNGLKINIPLYGNLKQIPNNTVLQLIQPKGGELLTPCEKYVIKWRGNTPNLGTKVEVSYNGGAEWIQIAFVKDSQYVWQVPDKITNNVKIRVSQAFSNPSNYKVNDGTSLPRFVAFNSTDSRLINVAENGFIYEWDLMNDDKPKLINQFQLNTAGEDKRFQVSGAEYINDDTSFWVTYFDTDGYRDSISFFNYQGSALPYKTFHLEVDYYVKNVIMDSKSKYLAILPSFGNQLTLMDIENETIIKRLKYNTIVNDAAFNPSMDTLTVVLLNGDLLHYSVPDMNLITKKSYPKMTSLAKIASSSNGKYLSLSQVSYSVFDGGDYQGLNTKHFVTDIETGNVLRIYEPAADDAVTVSFNSASSSILIGSKSQSQIAFYDMAKNQTAFTMAGNIGTMYYARVSHSGKSIASAGDNMRDLIYRSFNYPEEVTSNSFSIVNSDFNQDEIILAEQLIVTTTTYNISTICNQGPVATEIHDAKLSIGKHFAFETKWNATKIDVNDCLNFNFVYAPKDTGWVYDTLLFVSCYRVIRVPVKAYSKPRTFEYYTDNLDLGTACIGDTIKKIVTMFKNADNVPVLINVVDINFQTKETGIFFINQPKDTILQPGESYQSMIYFIPKKLGKVTAKVNIFFGNQDNVLMWFDLTATGIGSFVDINLPKVLFLPEVDTREIEITNTGNLPVTYNSINIIPSGNYELISQLPFTINPGDKAKVIVKWLQNSQTDAQLEFNTEPCVVQKYLPLAIYRGNSLVSVIDTVADPRGKATIAIKFRNGGNGEFKAKRYFSAEFTVNPRLFLPLDVTSDFGTGELIKNKIIDNKRYVEFRVFGDFPDTGFVANINGVAGLGETDVTAIEFTNNSKFWGGTVNTSFKNGILRLINVCDDRLTERNSNSFQINSVSPNPAIEKFEIKFDSELEGEFNLEIIDMNGNVVLTDKFAVVVGTNQKIYTISHLSIGKYKVILKHENQKESLNFIIIR